MLHSSTARACRPSQVAALVLAPALLASAQAATHELALTGQVASARLLSYESQGIHYDDWILRLSGLSAANGFSMALGDSFHATIALDQAVSVPTSTPYGLFNFSLTGTGFPPDVLAAISGTNLLFLQGVQVRAGGLGSSGFGELFNGMVLAAPQNQAFSFDAVVTDFTISALNTAQVSLDGAYIRYLAQHPVPEPAPWAILAAGLGLLAWRRRSSYSLKSM